MRHILFIPLLFVALATPCLAAPKDDEATKKAREHVDAAKTHFKLGEYDEAVAEFKEAYRIKNVPAILFNLGQASRLAKNYRQSKIYYESYLRDVPDAPNRAEVEEQVKQLSALVAEQEAPPKPVAVAPPVAAPAVVEPVATPAPAAPPATGTPLPAAATTPAPPPVEPKGTSMLVKGLLGVAGAALVVSIAAGLVSGSYATDDVETGLADGRILHTMSQRDAAGANAAAGVSFGALVVAIGAGAVGAGGLVLAW